MRVRVATPPEAHEALTSKGAIYLDVRTVMEFDAGHPAGAINVPVLLATEDGRLQQNRDFLTVVEGLIPRDRRVLCGCQAGGRSAAAANMLARAGYEHVVNVIGGFGGGPHPDGGSVVGWRDAGLPVSSRASEGETYAALRAKVGL